MDLTKYRKLIDVWEGSLDIDEGVLEAAGIAGIVPRMNDTVGGIHLDRNFVSQWEQAERFARMPYYVIAPWIYAKYQAQFVLDNWPKGAPKLLMSDVELHYTETPPNYMLLYNEFLLALEKYAFKIVTYTGQGYYNLLSVWPVGDYLLARYPYALYPPTSETITWSQLDAKLATVTYSPPPPPTSRGTVVGWQCSADRYKLPGCQGRAVDVIVMPNEHFDRLFPPPTKPNSVFSIFLPLIFKR